MNTQTPANRLEIAIWMAISYEPVYETDGDFVKEAEIDETERKDDS